MVRTTLSGCLGVAIVAALGALAQAQPVQSPCLRPARALSAKDLDAPTNGPMQVQRAPGRWESPEILRIPDAGFMPRANVIMPRERRGWVEREINGLTFYLVPCGPTAEGSAGSKATASAAPASAYRALQLLPALRARWNQRLAPKINSTIAAPQPSK